MTKLVPDNPGIFPAPWSAGLMATTLFATLTCLAVFAFMLPGMLRNGPATAAFWVGILPLLIPLLSSFFMVRSYRIENATLCVARLFWETRIPLAGLSAADIVPQAMQGGSKTLANSGLFAYCGRFYNPRLGAYRALVSDPSRTVVLHFGRRVLVVSPERPEDFLAALQPFIVAPATREEP